MAGYNFGVKQLKQFVSQILSLSPVAQGYYRLDFFWNAEADPKAGQFLTIRVGDLSTPLLRRPFALSAYDKAEGRASIIFQKIGKGTELLSQMKQGDSIDILGPLGNSFSQEVSPCDNNKKNHIVVAGGIGTGPMLYLADELKREGKTPLLIIGCRTKELVPYPEIDKSIKTVICTDDGSDGFKGNVVDYMRSNPLLDSDSVIYSCGPEPMLRGCQSYAEETGKSSYVSLEQMMACGIGACMGCTCETKNEKQKYARVCKEGPVFPGGEIKWT